MMRASDRTLESIQSHGAESYPEECCGFLLGRIRDSGNDVVATRPAANRRTEDRERRFMIAPEDALAAENAAREQGLDVVGFYHSHPDHPAEPSQTDLDEATFPGYTYVIVSVRRGCPGEVTAWSLRADRSRFDPIQIETTPEPSEIP